MFACRAFSSTTATGDGMSLGEMRISGVRDLGVALRNTWLSTISGGTGMEA